MQFPGPRDVFLNRLSAEIEAVRSFVTEADLDRFFPPRIPSGLEEQFFPGFTTLRQPDVSVHLITRFSGLPQHWKSHWHSRLWTNALGAMAVYDDDLLSVLESEGSTSLTQRAVDCYRSAISKHWGFALWSIAQAKASPDKTYFKFDLFALTSCFVIESVESWIDGKPGGWRLVEEVLHVLDWHGIEQGVPWIHATTINPDSKKLFLRYGFEEMPHHAGFHSGRATHLRRAVRRPTRPFEEPPLELKHLLPPRS